MSTQQQSPRMTVSAQTLQDILNYLAVRPFNEVSGLIEKLRNDAKLVEAAAEAPAASSASAETSANA